MRGEEWVAYWLLFVPTVVAAVPLLVAPGRARQIARVAAAVILVLWCLVALASVGLFFVPAAVLMVTAAVRGRST